MQMINEVERGTTRRTLVVTDTDPVTQVPLIVVRGASPGPTLLVTAGVHGCEYVSIEAANRVAAIDPSHLSGTLVVLPVVNLPSFTTRTIYVNPHDGKNLNRMFPGTRDGTFAERLAYWITNMFIKDADAYIDLHGGDMNEALTPFTIYRQHDEQAEQLARVFGLPNLLPSTSPGHSYSAGHAHGVPAILAESGGQGRLIEEDVTPLTDGVRRVMQHLRMLDGTPAEQPITKYREFFWLRSSVTGFWYPEVSVDDDVTVGQRLGTIKTLLGDIAQEAISSVDGKVMFAVTSLAINEGDPLMGVGVTG